MTSTTGRNSDRRSAGRRPPAASRRGFTLLELILVMIILCTSLAVVAPSLRGFWQGARSRDCALQVLALARWARSQSVTEARIYCLRFDPQAGTYRLEKGGGQGRQPIATDFGRTFLLPEDCRVEVTVATGGEPNCIRFYPSGRTDGTRIRLSGPGSEEAEIIAPSPTEDLVLLGDEEEGGLR